MMTAVAPNAPANVAQTNPFVRQEKNRNAKDSSWKSEDIIAGVAASAMLCLAIWALKDSFNSRQALHNLEAELDSI